MIEIQGLSKTFVTPAAQVQALREVDLTIAPGDIFGIVGFSGSGKSTLLRCINLLERPDAGTVRIQGQDATALERTALTALRRRMGMIFQHFHLFDARTVHANIAYPLEIAGASRARIEARVDELVHLVGIPDKLRAYPGQLSGGQKQRAAIARALASDPVVLLSDEATSALDPESTLAILELLKDINARTGLTIALVTHELDVVRALCNRVAVLEAGRVVESGPVDRLFAAPVSAAARKFVAIDRGFRNGDVFANGDGI
jgi:D-methionine transport system ATP-binding protein